MYAIRSYYGTMEALIVTPVRVGEILLGKLNYASSGNGSSYHMAAELFKSMADVSIVHVPYKGASTARTDLVGGFAAWTAAGAPTE